MFDKIDKFDGEYRFLSNFWECEIPYDGLVYKSTEAAYQAAKTNSYHEKLVIQSASTPGKAKRLGRDITMRPDWDDVKVDVMREILEIKFRDKELAERLLETADFELIEGNQWGDTFWGVCEGKGQNILGKLLMAIRNDLVL